MFASLSRRSTRIGPWPRRIAALVCLLLAAVSATSARPRSSAQPVVRGLASQLHHGEVAVPISIGTANARLLHPGDLIGVLAAPADAADDTASTAGARAVLIADHIRVLSVADTATGLNGDPTALIEVATSRLLAVAFARYSSRSLLAILDDPP